MNLSESNRHECWKQGWAACTACGGRLHKHGCTSRLEPSKDCCPKRHKALHDAGQVRGKDDSSVIMLDNVTVRNLKANRWDA